MSAYVMLREYVAPTERGFMILPRGRRFWLSSVYRDAIGFGSVRPTALVYWVSDEDASEFDVPTELNWSEGLQAACCAVSDVPAWDRLDLRL